MDITKEEQKAINSFKRLSKNWPKSLWLFSASGTLTVMKKKDGKRVMTTDSGNAVGGGVDPDYIVDTIKIENDGGDW